MTKTRTRDEELETLRRQLAEARAERDSYCHLWRLGNRQLAEARAANEQMRDRLQRALDYKVSDSSGDEVAEDSLHELRKEVRRALSPASQVAHDGGGG
jgi:chromosome segregation ATPase